MARHHIAIALVAMFNIACSGIASATMQDISGPAIVRDDVFTPVTPENKSAVITIGRIDNPAFPDCLRNANWTNTPIPHQQLSKAAIAVKTKIEKNVWNGSAYAPVAYDYFVLMTVNADMSTKTLTVHERTEFHADGEQAYATGSSASIPQNGSFDVVSGDIGSFTNKAMDIRWGNLNDSQSQVEPLYEAEIYLCPGSIDGGLLISTGDREITQSSLTQARIEAPECAVSAVAWRERVSAKEVFENRIAVRSADNRIGVLSAQWLPGSAYFNWRDDMIVDKVLLYEMRNKRLQFGDPSLLQATTLKIRPKDQVDIDKKKALGQRIDNSLFQGSDFRLVNQGVFNKYIEAVNGAKLATCSPPSRSTKPDAGEITYTPIKRIPFGDGANGKSCKVNTDCSSGYCANGQKCAPRDNGERGDYCHHDNHCKSGHCKCPDGEQTNGFCNAYERYTDSQILDYMKKEQMVCGLPRVPNGKACSVDAICSKGQVCIDNYCRAGNRD